MWGDGASHSQEWAAPQLPTESSHPIGYRLPLQLLPCLTDAHQCPEASRVCSPSPLINLKPEALSILSENVLDFRNRAGSKPTLCSSKPGNYQLSARLRWVLGNCPSVTVETSRLPEDVGPSCWTLETSRKRGPSVGS